MEDSSQNIENLLTIGRVLYLICVGGLIGGLADLLFHIRLGKDGFEHKPQVGDLGFDVALSGKSLIGLILVSIVIGVAGAIGVQAFIIMIDRFSSSDDVSNKLFILSLSVVAGFGARRLLPQIRDRIEDEIREVKKEARDASEDARDALEEVRVFEALKPQALSSERSRCIEHLRKELSEDPKNRTNTIMLGRLLRMTGDLPSAISVLSRFINRKAELDDIDVADALYNRACYNSLLLAQDDTKSQLLNSIKQDLEESFNLSPSNREDARRDDDFNFVRSNPVLSSLKINAPSS